MTCIVRAASGIRQKCSTVPAIGDTVNIASRVESATKDAGVELLVTNEVYDRVAEYMWKFRKW